MKIKLSKLIVFLILVILFLRIFYLFIRTEFENNYEIKYNEYNIKIQEKYKEIKKENKNIYLFNIEVENIKFEFQLFQDLKKEEKIIKKVYFYNEEDYNCIFPIFKDNNQYIDIICNIDSETLYYHDIEDVSEGLKNFANSIKEYDQTKYNKNSNEVNYENVTFNNNYDGYGLITNYKGYYDLKNKNSVRLFEKDIYDQSITAFIDKYYIVADYNQTYEFDKLYIIDITNGKKKEITCYPKISFDSYIQGIVNNELYLYDKINKKQYKINPQNLSIETIGNINKGIQIYKNNNWEIETSSNCTNNIILFDSEYKSDIDDTKYEKIDKVGDEIGYYYFYEKKDNDYKVYRSSLQDKDYKIYLFTAKTIDRIKYYNNDVYYIDDEILKRYSDEDGIINVLSFKEFKFNISIDFGIYKK